MDITVVINQMIILFLLMAVGYIIARVGVVGSVFKDNLSTFIINVTMPLMIISAVTSSTVQGNAEDVLTVFILSIVTYLVLPVLAFVLNKILSVPKEDRNLYTYMTIFSNIAFMGFPVILSIFGEGAIFYAAIFNLMFNFMNFSLGIALMTEDNSGHFDIKNFLKPGIFASVLAVILFFTKITLPAPIVDTMKNLGDTTSPLAMIVIGMSLSQIPLRSVFTEIRLYPYTILKQIIIPYLSWLLLRNLITSDLILGITVIVIAMPVGTSAVLFSTEYHGNTILATKTVFITTLASLITIPLIVYTLL